jgi:sugar lactone lactonase YvrE
MEREMVASRFMHRALGAAAAMMLAACGGSQPPIGAPDAMPLSLQSSPVFTRSAAEAVTDANKGASYLYVANQTNAGYPIEIFLRDDPSKGPIDHIGKILAPDGIFVDSHGTLYATTAWESGNSSVWAYKRGAHKPFRIYSGAYCAFDVVAGDDGTVYIADACGGPHTRGRVLVYTPGQTKPSRSFFPGGAPYCLTLDAKNNLYVGYNSEYSYWGQVKRYRPDARHGVDLLPNNTVFFVTGIAVDEHGALLVAGNGVINVFTQKGKPPSRVIKTGQTYPHMFTFDRRENVIYVSDSCSCCGSAKPNTYTRPGAGPLTSSGCGSLPDSVVALDYTTGQRLWILSKSFWGPTGVAVSPPAPF